MRRTIALSYFYAPSQPATHRHHMDGYRSQETDMCAIRQPHGGFDEFETTLCRQSTEQRAIAGVLGALDDKIEQNRRTARALERLARAIFRAWFVDFEPVKAKAAGARFLSLPCPSMVFDALPTRIVDSEIGLVPEGWEVKTDRSESHTSSERTGASEVPAFASSGERLARDQDRRTTQGFSIKMPSLG